MYDGFGDLIQESRPNTGTTVYYYDSAGNLTKRVAATLAVTQYTYDALDRVLTMTFPADSAENVTYTYDQSGHGDGIGRLDWQFRILISRNRFRPCKNETAPRKQ